MTLHSNNWKILKNTVCDKNACIVCVLNRENVYKGFSIVSGISVQFSSVTQSCLTLCDPMNRSTPGLPVHHQLPEFTQTHAH